MNIYEYHAGNNTLTKKDKIPMGWHKAVIKATSLSLSAHKPNPILTIEFYNEEYDKTLFYYIYLGFTIFLQKICDVLDIEKLTLFEREDNPCPELVGKEIDIKVVYKERILGNDSIITQEIISFGQKEK